MPTSLEEHFIMIKGQPLEEIIGISTPNNSPYYMEKGEIDNLAVVGDLNPLFSGIGTTSRHVSSQWKTHTRPAAFPGIPDSPFPRREDTSSQSTGMPCGLGVTLGLRVSTHFTGPNAHTVYSVVAGRVRSRSQEALTNGDIKQPPYSQWGEEDNTREITTYLEVNENETQ